MKRHPIESGWCQTDHHQRCPHQIQTGNDRRPTLWCACQCHTGKEPLFR